MNSTIDEQFVEFIVKSVVSKPDDVKIERRIDEKGVLLELSVDPEDLGRVIGKRGATAQSLRTLLRALGTKNDARYNLKIIDTSDGHPPARESSAETSPAKNTDAPAPAEPMEEIEEPREIAHNDVVNQTRKELEEMDDLDV